MRTATVISSNGPPAKLIGDPCLIRMLHSQICRGKDKNCFTKYILLKLQTNTRILLSTNGILLVFHFEGF